MGVNANPRARVTAVIWRRVQTRAWKVIFEARSGNCGGGKQSESLAEREAFERRIEK